MFKMSEDHQQRLEVQQHYHAQLDRARQCVIERSSVLSFRVLLLSSTFESFFKKKGYELG